MSCAFRWGNLARIANWDKVNWLQDFNEQSNDFKSLGWCVLRHGENTVYCRLLDKVPNNWVLSHLNLKTVWSVCIMVREIAAHRTINYFYFYRNFVIKCWMKTKYRIYSTISFELTKTTRYPKMHSFTLFTSSINKNQIKLVKILWVATNYSSV